MNELNFMPFFEIRLINEIDEKYDIFTSRTDGEVDWDNYLSIDYEKISKYI